MKKPRPRVKPQIKDIPITSVPAAIDACIDEIGKLPIEQQQLALAEIQRQLKEDK